MGESFRFSVLLAGLRTSVFPDIERSAEKQNLQDSLSGLSLL